jgi:hypothetical protein
MKISGIVCKERRLTNLVLIKIGCSNEAFMKVLILISFAFTFSFAGERYGVYDLQGKRVFVFEAERHELPEKTRQIKAVYPNRSLYVSSLPKGRNSKPLSRYRYKAETGAYIEASRNETFAICPDKEIQGTWISEHSVALNAENCLSVQAPNLAGTFRILFVENSGRTDTIQVLVEQSYIQMGDYSHKVWVNASGHYDNKKYEQALIVDKTEFTMRDAQHYSQFGIELNPWIDPNYKWGNSPRFSEAYLPSENLKTSMRPYLSYYDAWKIANVRSKLEGLDTVYSLVLTQDGEGEFIIDSSASGYRMPFMEEWGMLMRAGTSTRYYWGDEEDSLTVSRYTQVRPIGHTQHKVAQKQPNAFGLYDMISPNNTNTSCGIFSMLCGSDPFINRMPECRFLSGEVARKIETNSGMCLVNLASGTKKCNNFISSFHVSSLRLLRKTPKLHKLEKL